MVTPPTNDSTDRADVMKDYKFTLLGLFLGVSLYIGVMWADFDLFELLVGTLHEIEHYEIDELIFPLLIIFSFSYYEHLQKSRRRKIELERYKTFRAMMSSMDHILNNFLNQMGLFRLTAEETPEFDSTVLKLYDEVIDSTSAQIKTLGEITEFDEDTINETVRPK